MKKYLAWFLVLLLLMFCTACAAEEAVLVEGFTFSEETGYAYSAVPLGVSLQEVSEALNCTLVSKAESFGGTHDPEHDAYRTLEFDAVDVLGKKAGVEAVFDNGALYDLSFIVQMDDGKEGETLYQETVEDFKKSFGEPMTEKENSVLWRHENNTQILIQITPMDERAIIQIGVADITVLLEE